MICVLLLKHINFNATVCWYHASFMPGTKEIKRINTRRTRKRLNTLRDQLPTKENSFNYLMQSIDPYSFHHPVDDCGTFLFQTCFSWSSPCCPYNYQVILTDLHAYKLRYQRKLTADNNHMVEIKDNKKPGKNCKGPK